MKSIVSDCLHSINCRINRSIPLFPKPQMCLLSSFLCGWEMENGRGCEPAAHTFHVSPYFWHVERKEQPSSSRMKGKTCVYAGRKERLQETQNKLLLVHSRACRHITRKSSCFALSIKTRLWLHLHRDHRRKVNRRDRQTCPNSTLACFSHMPL